MLFEREPVAVQHDGALARRSNQFCHEKGGVGKRSSRPGIGRAFAKEATKGTRTVTKAREKKPFTCRCILQYSDVHFREKTSRG